MKNKSFISRFVRGLALLLLLLLVAVAALLVFDVPIPLDRFREDIDEQLTAVLGRDVSIDGKILLITGITPSLRLEEVTLGNPLNWKGEGDQFASCERFETTLALGELLNREIDLNNITIVGLHLTLEEDGDGGNNWESLTAPGENAPAPAPENDETAEMPLQFSELNFITVTDLSVTHRIGGEPVESVFSIDSLMGSAREDEPIQLAVSGRFKDLPFDGTFKGGTLKAFLAGAHEWPFDFEADLHGATIDVRGKMAAHDFKIPATLDFTLKVPEIERLNPLIGPLPLTGPIDLSGKVAREAIDRYRFPELKGTLADASVSGNVSLDLAGKLPRLEGEIDIDTIDLASIGAMKGDAPDAGDQEQGPQTGDDESPHALLPVTGEFTVRLKELIGFATTIRDVDLDLKVGETAATAEIGVEFAGDPFTGRLSLERTANDSPVSMEIDLTGNDSDVTEIVRYFTGSDRFSGQFETGRFHIEGTGESLAAAWESRRIRYEMTNAEMSWRSDAKEWQFFLEAGTVTRQSGSPGEIIAKGTIGEVACDLRAAYHLMEDDVTSRFDEFSGTLADVTFEFRNLSKDDGITPSYRDLEFAIKGERLDQLDSVYDLDLPPVGPYAASGILRRNGDEVAVEKMDLRIRDNQLLGSWQLDRGAKPRKLTGKLNAETLQLGEFSGGGWSPIVKSLQSGDAEEAVQKSRRKLLSREILSNYDIAMELEVGSVLSGSDHLGKGRLTLALEQARLRVDPLSVDIPGGHFDGSFLFHPNEDGSLDWNIKVDARKADYSILARRINPDSKAAGKLNLNLDIGASGVPVGALQLNVASGDLSFNVCPKDVNAAKLDIWAISLVRALLPKLDPDNQSTLNCVLGKLHLEDGLLTPELLGLDTTTIRVSAEGQIDLKNDTIDLKLTPYPKKPQLLSIEAPVSIEGSLEDPEIGMGTLAGVRTIGRMAKNLALFPLKALASERLPEDGSDICACAENYNPDPDQEDSLIPEEGNDRDKAEEEKERK